MTGSNGHGAMSRELDPHADSIRPIDYRVRITGQLDPRWADWFEGMTIMLDGGDTLITGPVIDQAALHGLLKRVRDLGMPLVSVGPVGPAPSVVCGIDQADAPEVTSDGGASPMPPGREDLAG